MSNYTREPGLCGKPIAKAQGWCGISRDLNLWKKQLGRVPDSVWEQTELETLVLAENGLTEVPDAIGRLKRLRMLDLGHNTLTSVPEGLGELDGLADFLYLHDNRCRRCRSLLVG